MNKTSHSGRFGAGNPGGPGRYPAPPAPMDTAEKQRTHEGWQMFGMRKGYDLQFVKIRRIKDAHCKS